ncbi:hypothetical protein BV22DRAFT_861008 [Leucogyrophana mollusca]|uniref:Uncharacterized protein n=1 Tax=Leucogyrophana mollusca TaxID=85980 RepID=A0ACB8B169_9AGAM|nr:hypothetical protein BV22DRAFT_861008 [Leucogyrophana mollusca]
MITRRCPLHSIVTTRVFDSVEWPIRPKLPSLSFSLVTSRVVWCRSVWQIIYLSCLPFPPAPRGLLLIGNVFDIDAVGQRSRRRRTVGRTWMNRRYRLCETVYTQRTFKFVSTIWDTGCISRPKHYMWARV